MPNFYVENQYGTAGMGGSYGMATVVEIEESDNERWEAMTHRYEQTRSVSGPYATREEAQIQADEYNLVHDAYRAEQDR